MANHFLSVLSFPLVIQSPYYPAPENPIRIYNPLVASSEIITFGYLYFLLVKLSFFKFLVLKAATRLMDYYNTPDVL